MKKFTEEQINALNIVKGMFSEQRAHDEWWKECPNAESDQSVGATLEYSVHLIDELLGTQKSLGIKESLSNTLLSQEYTDKCKELQRLYRPLSNKLAEYHMQLAVDMRGDHFLVAIPDDLFFGNGKGEDYKHGVPSGFLLDHTIALDEPEHDLVIALDGTEKIIHYGKI